MTYKSSIKWGDWVAICDVCGFKFKASKLRERWDGLMVCQEDWEFRHPQDLIRYPKEDTSIPWSSPEQADTFISITYVASTVGIQGSPIPDGTFDTFYLYLEDGTSFLLLEDTFSRLELG